MGKLFFKVTGVIHRGIYRASGGRLGGRMGGLNVLLLTTTGRRSGKPRTVQLLSTPTGDSYAVIASMGGAPKNPDWCLNLRRNPAAVVELGRERFAVRAHEAEGEERERLWRAMADTYKGYDRYQEKTTRRIPVVVLERTGGDAARES